MKCILSLLVLIFLFSVSAKSQDWIFVGSGSKGSKYYMRAGAATLSATKKVWVKTVSETIKYFKNGKYYTLFKGHSIDLLEFECDNRQLRFLKVVYYDSKGNNVHSVTREPFEAEFEDAIPDSIGEMLLEKACSLF